MVICRDELGNARPNIDGDDHVAVYTDEHGEAFVAYNPNTGFRWNADSNGRCNLAPALSGTATITAEGIYPDQPVLWDQASKVSNSLTKTVNSLASKTLACVPKGLNEMFCVETILDIQGRPVGCRGPVQPDAARQHHGRSVKHGPFDTTGQTVVGDGDELNSDPDHDRRQRSGRRARHRVAAWSVRRRQGRERRHALGPEPARHLPVRSDDAGGRYHRLRHRAAGWHHRRHGRKPDRQHGWQLDGWQRSGTGDGFGRQPAETPVPAAAKQPVVVAKPAVAAKVVSAQLLIQKGSRYLQLRVKSPLAKAKVRIVLIGKNGKTSRVVLRTIATNRMVVVPILKLGKLIKSVRVSVA